MVRRLPYRNEPVDVVLPATAAELYEWRVYICGLDETDPAAYHHLTGQWLARYTDRNALEWVNAGSPVELAVFAELICLSSELPPSAVADLYTRLGELYETDVEKERDAGAFTGALPWQIRTASVAFAIAQNGPGVLALAPWAYNAAAILRDVEALATSDDRDHAEQVAERDAILSRLGLDYAPGG